MIINIVILLLMIITTNYHYYFILCIKYCFMLVSCKLLLKTIIYTINHNNNFIIILFVLIKWLFIVILGLIIIIIIITLIVYITYSFIIIIHFLWTCLCAFLDCTIKFCENPNLIIKYVLICQIISALGKHIVWMFWKVFCSIAMRLLGYECVSAMWMFLSPSQKSPNPKDSDILVQA